MSRPKYTVTFTDVFGPVLYHKEFLHSKIHSLFFCMFWFPAVWLWCMFHSLVQCMVYLPVNACKNLPVCSESMMGTGTVSIWYSTNSCWQCNVAVWILEIVLSNFYFCLCQKVTNFMSYQVQVRSNHDIYHSLDLFFLTVVFTASKISFTFNGVISEIGRYPFAKILIASAYMCSCFMNLLFIWTNLSLIIHQI